jgi:hypothetical protein
LSSAVLKRGTIGVFLWAVSIISNTLTLTSTPGMRKAEDSLQAPCHYAHLLFLPPIGVHLPVLFNELTISLECISLNAVLDVQICAAIQQHPVNGGFAFIVNLMEM